MAKTMCRILGVALLIVGIVGFVLPSLALATNFDVIRVVVGGIACFLGWRGTYKGSRLLCWVGGALFLILGLGVAFGTVDSIVNLVTGLLFLGTAIMRPRLSERTEGVFDAAKQKLGV